MFVAFSLYPIIVTAYLSFTRYDMLTPPEWYGLGNYASLMQDPLFWQSVKATVYYVFGTYVPTWFLALAIALALNREFRLKGFFRALYFTPVVMSMVVVAVIWKLMYHPFGLINNLFSFAITQPIGWLTDQRLAPLALVIMSIWKSTGYFMVIFLAGLQGIPTDYYEAARIDGASGWQQFCYITLPLLKPVTTFVVIMSLLMGLQEFTAQYVMTGGGPVGATRVLALLVYETAFNFLKMGRATAISMILFFVLLAITWVQLRVLGDREEAQA